MTGRVCLGWRVSRDEWDAFVRFVEEKWDATEGYVRFELESAMREFMDHDGRLHDAEQLLRDYLQSHGLSSSSVVIGQDPGRGDTTQLGYRVNDDLKHDFAAYAKEHYDANLGAILGRALNSYRDGGRRQRVLELVQQLVTGGSAGDHTADSDESMSVNEDERDHKAGSDESSAATDESNHTQRDHTADIDERPKVDAILVSNIADEVGDQFLKKDLEDAIARVVGTDIDPELLSSYRDAVITYQNVVEHPVNDGLYISKQQREQMTVYDDLDREGRVEALQVMMCVSSLVDRAAQDSASYTEVQDMFEEEYSQSPSDDYVYKLMRDAADEAGFDYNEEATPSRLEVRVKEVADRFLHAAREFRDVDGELVTQLLDDHVLVVDELEGPEEHIDIEVTSYSAGQPPTAAQQKGAADDD